MFFYVRMHKVVDIILELVGLQCLGNASTVTVQSSRGNNVQVSKLLFEDRGKEKLLSETGIGFNLE